jgi:hypothetical protein
MGRKTRELDYELIKRLASLQCTEKEIAATIDADYSWLSARKGKDELLQQALEDGYEVGKTSLRHKQWEIANSGNVTMCIWLGKQYLKQSDHNTISGDKEAPLEVKIDYSKLSIDELKTIDGIFEKVRTSKDPTGIS